MTQRLALISDVHADVHALEEALDRIDRLGVDSVLCAGDLVGVGLFPGETIALLARRGVVCVAGNHDRWAIGRGSAHRQAEEPSETWDASGLDLSDEALAYLESLPGLRRLDVAGCRVVVCHGTARSDMDAVDPVQATAEDVGRALREADADILHVGHIHLASALTLPGGGMVVNPGCLGREGEDTGVRPWLLSRETGRFAPVPESPRGTFGVLSLPDRDFKVYRASDGAEVEILRRRLGVVDHRGG